MKYYKYIIYIFVFAFCLNVKAEGTCTTDEMNRLKELANNVEIVKNLEVDDRYYTLEHNINDIYYYYSIKITNLSDELLIFYSYGDNEKIMLNEETIKNVSFYSDSKATFYIYAFNSNTCSNKILKTITIDFDKYNLYYYLNQEKCNQNKEFKYCKEYMDIGNKTYDEIDKLFNEYLNINKTTTTDNKYIYYIVGGFIVVSLIITIMSVIIHKYKKNKL